MTHCRGTPPPKKKKKPGEAGRCPPTLLSWAWRDPPVSGGLAGISSLSLSSSQSPWVGSRGSKGRISNVSSRGEGGVLFVPESVSAKAREEYDGVNQSER